jgi:3-phosphoshikimate 1-carboxyvinyltransferase
MARGSSCTIEGLGRSSLQGDVGIARVLEHLGATVHADERAIAVSCDQRGGGPREPLIADLSLMPDAIMTLAVVCSFAPGNSLVGGASTLRVKETDRIAALATELAKLGVVAEPVGVGKDESLRISPPARAIDCSPTAPRVEFDTYDDHRMAMSLALIGLRRPNIFIRNPACVSKTYPSFWRDLSTLYESS